MTVTAFYIGGPHDGTMREERDSFETKVIHVLPGGPAAWGHSDEPVRYDNVQHFVYTRMHMPYEYNCAFVIYKPRNWSVEKALERLIEYYRPERDEQ